MKESRVSEKTNTSQNNHKKKNYDELKEILKSYSILRNFRLTYKLR